MQSCDAIHLAPYITEGVWSPPTSAYATRFDYMVYTVTFIIVWTAS